MSRRTKLIMLVPVCIAATALVALAVVPNGAPTHPALAKARLTPLSIEDLASDVRGPQNYRLSPDGKRIAWTQFDGDAVRTGLRDLPDGAPTLLPHGSLSMEWSRDGKYLLLVKDHAGDENHHIYAMPAAGATPEQRDLTPHAGARAMIVGTTVKAPGEVFVAHNKRVSAHVDLHRIDIATGKETLVEQNPGSVVNWLVDPHHRYLGRIRQDKDRRALEVRAIADGKEPWREISTWAQSDSVSVVGWGSEEPAVWTLSNAGADRVSLRRIDLPAGTESVFFEDPRVDLDFDQLAPLVGMTSGRPIMANSEPDYPAFRVFERRMENMIEGFIGGKRARVGLESVSDREHRAVIFVFDGKQTTRFLVDLEAKSVTPLTKAIDGQALLTRAETTAVVFQARDGVQLNGYLTLPPGIKKPSGLPMVVRVHGGPWFRNIWGNTNFAPAATQVQFLASRGYAVLEVNFRGSTGYGRKFMESAVGQFGKAMQTDLLDGVKWAVDAGHADPARVAIMGTSYGGYAALMALGQDAKTFSCGVAVSAPSDLEQLIKSFPDYWELELATWHRYVGDPKDPKARAQLYGQSPMAVASSMVAPLLLVHGVNDPRVKVDHSRNLVKVLQEARLPAKYLEFEGEGHEFTGTKAKGAMYRAIENHLAGCLGGARKSGLIL